jgi:hypothetical protein
MAYLSMMEGVYASADDTVDPDENIGTNFCVHPLTISN